MRNIWQVVVGIVVVAGIGVALLKFFDDGTIVEAGRDIATRVANEATEAAGGGAATEAAAVPEERFSDIKIEEDDFVMGSADAPVTIVEYASLTCPHCARFHTEVLPMLKSEYIDTGKVRLVYRDFPLDRLAVAGSVLARCSGRDRYFGFIDVLYAQQASWSTASSPLIALGKIAQIGGLSQEEFQACMQDKDLQDAVLKQRMFGAQTFGITGTPTLLVNGDKYGGGLSATQMRTVLDTLLSKS